MSLLTCGIHASQAYLLARAIQFWTPGVPMVYYVGLFAGANDEAVGYVATLLVQGLKSWTLESAVLLQPVSTAWQGTAQTGTGAAHMLALVRGQCGVRPSMSLTRLLPCS